MFYNREEQAREIAQQLAQSLTELTNKLARLEEQQRTDERTFVEVRRHVRELQLLVQELEKAELLLSEEVSNLLERIQYLEVNLSADLDGTYLRSSAFDAYIHKLKEEAISLREERVKAQQKARKQAGLVIASVIGALLPQILKLIAWLLDLLLD